MTYFVIGGLILLAIWFAVKSTKANQQSDATTESIKPEPKPKPKPTVEEEEKKKAETNNIEEDHRIKILYSFSPNRSLWICPNCEVENSDLSRTCHICGYSKDSKG